MKKQDLIILNIFNDIYNQKLKKLIPKTENNKSNFWNERLNVQNLNLENLDKNLNFIHFFNR